MQNIGRREQILNNENINCKPQNNGSKLIPQESHSAFPREFGKDITNVVSFDHNSQTQNDKTFAPNSTATAFCTQNSQIVNNFGSKDLKSQTMYVPSQKPSSQVTSILVPKGLSSENNLNNIFQKINPSNIINQESLDELVITNENVNPQLVTEYQNDIFEYLKKIESQFVPKFNYMKGYQTDINDKMRSILIDWLVDVHLKFKLLPETLFLTVNLIDRYLEKNIIKRTKLQLVGVTAMLIACKYEEIYAPEVRDFVYITDQAYNKEEILKLENHMLSCLEFNITTPSSFRFLEHYANILKLDEISFMFCRYLLELLLVDSKTNRFSPAHQSAAAIYITLKITKKIEHDLVAKISEFPEDKLRECAKDLCLIIDSEEKSTLKAVKKKFSQSKYLEVSKIKFFN